MYLPSIATKFVCTDRSIAHFPSRKIRELVPLTNFRQDYPKSHSRFVHTISDRRSEYEALVAWVLDMPEQRSAAQLETVTTLERLSLEAVGYGVHLPFRFKPRFFLCEQADS